MLIATHTLSLSLSLSLSVCHSLQLCLYQRRRHCDADGAQGTRYVAEMAEGRSFMMRPFITGEAEDLDYREPDCFVSDANATFA